MPGTKQLVSQGITFKCPHKSGKVIGESASEPPEDQEVILAGEFSPDARVVVTEEDIAEASTTGDVRIGEDQDLSTSADRESTEDSAEESEDHNLSSLIQSDTKIDPKYFSMGNMCTNSPLLSKFFSRESYREIGCAVWLV